MAGKGFFNKSQRGPEQQDAHVKTDRLALQAGMRQQHQEGTESAPGAGSRDAMLGALTRAKADYQRYPSPPNAQRVKSAQRNHDNASNLFAHGDSDPSKRHAYGAHHK